MSTLEKWLSVQKKPVSAETYQEYMEAFFLMIYEGKQKNVMRFNNTIFEIHVDVLETWE